MADGKLNAYPRERATQVVIGYLYVLGGDIYAVRVQLCQYLRHGFLYQVVDVYRIDIAVVYQMQQVVQLVAAAIDDAEPVAREVVGIERANQDADDHTQGHCKGREAVFVVHCCFLFDISMFRSFEASTFHYSPR